MERRRIVFSGRVQGVGFRATAQAVASRFDVTGWVRNVEDGTVEMEIQGDPAEIDRCLGALRSAMGRRITNERVERATVVSLESEFVIRR